MPTYPLVALTGNSSPSPYVASASTELSSSYAAWKAFNKVETGDTNQWACTAIPAWLQIDLGASLTVSQYRMSQLTFAATAPKDWILAGSNNGSSWTTIDTRSGVIGWSGLNTYAVASPGAYRYYRITVSANVSWPFPQVEIGEIYLDVAVTAIAATTGRGSSVATCTAQHRASAVVSGRGSPVVSAAPARFALPVSSGRGSTLAAMTYGINGDALTGGRGSVNAGSSHSASMHPITTGRGSHDVLSESAHGGLEFDALGDGRGSSVVGMRKTITSAHAVSLPAIVAAFRADPVAAAAGKTRDLWASTVSPRVYDDIRGYIGGRHRGRLPFVEIEQSAEQYTQRAADLGMHPSTWDVMIHVGGLDETAAEIKARNILGTALAVLRATGHSWLGDSNGGQFSKDPLGYVLAATIGLRNTYDPANFDTITG